MRSISVGAAVAISAILVALEAAGCRDKSEADKQMYIRAAYLSQALALASTTKVHVSAYYDEHGEMPSSNEEAGLSPAADYADESVSGVAVSEGGVITVRFNDKSGVEERLLRLVPDASKPDVGLSWRCRTRGFKEISPFVPQCKPED